MRITELKKKKRWQDSRISPESLELLDEIGDRRWVMESCVKRIPENAEAARLLIEYGLKQTDKVKNGPCYDGIRSHLEYAKDGFEYVKPSCSEDPLNASEWVAYRRKLLDQRSRLEVYQELGILGIQFNKYVISRDRPIIEIATNFALRAKLKWLAVVLQRFPELREHLLSILSFIPEGVDPDEYKDLLKLLVDENVPIRNKDWCEDGKICALKFLNHNPYSLLAYLKNVHLQNAGDLKSWCVDRIFKIDTNTGLISHALKLASIMYKEIGIIELRFVFEAIQILYEFVYSPNNADLVRREVRIKDFLYSEIDTFIIKFLNGYRELMVDKSLKEKHSTLYTHIARNLVIPYIILSKRWKDAESDILAPQYLPSPALLKSQEEIVETLVLSLLNAGYYELLYATIDSLGSCQESMLANPKALKAVLANVLFNGNVYCSMSVVSNIHLLETEGLEQYGQDIRTFNRISPLLEKLNMHLPLTQVKSIFSPDSDPNELKYLLRNTLGLYFDNIRKSTNNLPHHTTKYLADILSTMEKIVDIYISINISCKKSELMSTPLILRLSLTNLDLELVNAVSAGKLASTTKECLTNQQIEDTVMSVVEELSDSSLSGDPNDKYMKLSNLYLNLLPETPSVAAERRFLKTIYKLTSMYKLSFYNNPESIALPSQIRTNRYKSKLIHAIVNSSKYAYLDAKTILNISRDLLGPKWNNSEDVHTIAIILNAAIDNDDTPTGSHLFKILSTTYRSEIPSPLSPDKIEYINSTCDKFSSYSSRYDPFISQVSSSFLFKLPFRNKGIFDYAGESLLKI